MLAAALAALLPATADAGAVEPRIDDRHHSLPLSRAGVDRALFAAASTPDVGTAATWLAVDASRDESYPKRFTLRALGQRVEVWVADDLSFPEGDCRNAIEGGARVRLDDTQLRSLVAAFDGVVVPRLARVFGELRPRDGTRSTADPAVFRPGGDGDRVVLLVDNVRDRNYYDADNAGNRPYVVGFFSRTLTEFFDRNVLTLDVYDWRHRAGGNPPHEPAPGDLCASAPARPFLIEAALAHEYHHLLHYYADPDETTWVDEGLADHAQTLTGYADPRRSIAERGHDRHVQCFLGWMGVRTAFNPNTLTSGPENSLTRWGDAGAEHVLCDYGAAYTFVEFLAGRYGTRLVAALFRERASGLDGLARALRRMRIRATPSSLLADWAAMVALDGVLDGGARLRGGRAARFRTPTLGASVNWDAELAFAAPGAPPNGSDYVRLRGARGRYLPARAIRSIAFASSDPLLARGRRFVVQLVAYSAGRRSPAFVARLPLDRRSRGRLAGARLHRAIGTSATVVGAVVTFVDPGERASRPARYRLVVNGVRQPGG